MESSGTLEMTNGTPVGKVWVQMREEGVPASLAFVSALKPAPHTPSDASIFSNHRFSAFWVCQNGPRVSFKMQIPSPETR